MTKVQMICGKCKSTNVARDAWAEWNQKRQAWELANVFDYGECLDCEDEKGIEEIPLGHWVKCDRDGWFRITKNGRYLRAFGGNDDNLFQTSEQAWRTLMENKA